MDQDWDTWDQQYADKRASKWLRIDLGTATDREIREYTNARLYDLNACFQDLPDAHEMFCAFSDYFKKFTAKDFNRLE
jgi:hypothetical protein